MLLKYRSNILPNIISTIALVITYKKFKKKSSTNTNHSKVTMTAQNNTYFRYTPIHVYSANRQAMTK